MKKNRLTTKDLMTVGIFTALYLVVIFVAMMAGYIPVVIPFLGGIMALVGGIPFMLYLSKVNTFGMVSLTGILSGLVFFLMGSGLSVLVFGIVFGIIADFIMKNEGYKNFKKLKLGYAVFSIWTIGFNIRMYVDRANYFSSQVEQYGQEYVDKLISLTPGWTLPLSIIATFVLGYVGALLGTSMFKKHFKRAEIN